MSSRAGGNSRASKYDYLIKLLLIGDSGKFLLLSYICDCNCYQQLIYSS